MAETQGISNILNNSYDTVSKTIETVTINHSKIHSGEHYIFISRSTASSSQNLDIGLTVENSTKLHHTIFIASSRLQAEWFLYEGSSFTSGTTITAYNSNRNSTNTATLTATKNPNIGTTGTMIDNVHLSARQGISGGGAGDRIQWILKNNTKYIVRLDSNGDGNAMTQKIAWYEI